MPTPDLALVREFKRRAEQALPGRIVRVMLYGSRARGDAREIPTGTSPSLSKVSRRPTDRRVLSDIDFDLMMELGQHVQAIAIDHAQSAEQSYFVTNVLKDGLVA